MKTSEKSILGAELIRQVNQGLRKGLQTLQQLVDKMTTEEHVSAVKETLVTTVENINGLTRNHATVDADVLEAFKAVVQDIRNFNAHNGEEVIPIAREIDEILAGSPITQTTHHANHHDLGTPLLDSGASDYHPPHYQTMMNNNHTHVVGASAHQDSDCCCSCILM